jgi:chemotaxis protein methyltransferase CheR
LSLCIYGKENHVIRDPNGVQFLQWCLPRLHLRWPGFRKVRRQVYKRLNRRMQELQLSGLDEYRSYLENHPTEWALLDTLCWISISRFYRDKGVFQYLERDVFPHLAQSALSNAEKELRCWSAGCAAGEEPYTLTMLWRHTLAARFPTLGMRIVATDIDPHALRRAERGCYPSGSLKDLPQEWLARAFVPAGEEYCLRPDYRETVTFLQQDIRETAPAGPFHLILCRYLVFTYFDDALQQETLRRMTQRLVPGGALVIGVLETLPEGVSGLESWSKRQVGVYRKIP